MQSRGRPACFEPNPHGLTHHLPQPRTVLTQVDSVLHKLAAAMAPKIDVSKGFGELEKHLATRSYVHG